MDIFPRNVAAAVKYLSFEWTEKVTQVTILLWTGGQGHPTPIHNPYPSTNTHYKKKHVKRLFFNFLTFVLQMDQRTDRLTNRQTNRWTNRGMDKASYRVVCLQLKQGQRHGYPSRVRVGRSCNWGHQIIWAGAVRPKPQKNQKSKVWQTDRQMGRQTNKAGCIVALHVTNKNGHHQRHARQ